MAAEMWYYTTEGKQMDPVSIRELRRLVEDGLLRPTDMVWKDGMERWIRASSVKELFPDPGSDSIVMPAHPGRCPAAIPATSTDTMPAPTKNKPPPKKTTMNCGPSDAKAGQRARTMMIGQRALPAKGAT